MYDSDKVGQAINHYQTSKLPPLVFIDESDLILSGYENFKAAEALELDEVVTKRSNPPLSLAEKQNYLINDGHHAVAALFGATLKSLH